MTDKELRKLKRTELLEIMLQLQKELDVSKSENQSLRQQLEEAHRNMIDANTVTELRELLNAAKKTAEDYLNQMQRLRMAQDTKNAETGTEMGR